MVEFISYYLNSGSGRVLNCIRIANAIRDSQEPDEGPLLFRTPLLNRCVLIKDVYVGRTRGGAIESASVKTKLYLPYNKNDIAEGGQSVFFGTVDFAPAMADLIDMEDHTRRENFNADQNTLMILDSIPTFAPFLLKDRLARAGISVNARYHELPVEEWRKTYNYVLQRFRKILDAVMPGGDQSNPNNFNRLLSRLWEFNDPVALQNLAMVFKLPPDKSEEAFYSWKGIIFLSYEYGRHQPVILEFIEWLRLVATQSSMRPDPRDKDSEERAQRILSYVNRIKNEVDDQLSTYETAFEDLFVTGKGADRFSNFLLHAEGYFQSVGIRMGRLLHGVEVWDHTSGRFMKRRMHQEVFHDLLLVLDDVLGTIDIDFMKLPGSEEAP